MKFLFSGFYNILSLILGLGIFIFLIAEAGMDRFFALISGMSIPLLLSSLLMYGVSWIFRTWRLKRLTDIFELHLSFWEVFKVHICSFAINAILPAKAGDMAMAVVIRNKGSKIGKAAAIVFQTRILDVIALVFLLLPSLFLLRNNQDLHLPSLIVACLMVVFLPFLVTLDREKRFSQWLEKLEKNVSHRFAKLAALKTKDAYEAYHLIVFDKSLLILCIFLSIGAWLAEGLVTWLVGASLGVDAAPAVFVVSVILANVSKSFPLTPGGVGIYEGILTTSLVWFGVPFEAAVAIAICDHFFKKLFNLVWGLSFLPEFGKDFSALMEPNKERLSS